MYFLLFSKDKMTLEKSAHKMPDKCVEKPTCSQTGSKTSFRKDSMILILADVVATSFERIRIKKFFFLTRRIEFKITEN